MLFHNFGRIVNLVSLEPLPKQGCETEERETMSYDSSLSGTPAEAGVRAGAAVAVGAEIAVSVEPLPKQGCELHRQPSRLHRLSGTPAEAGVRGAGAGQVEG